jgi:Cu(I)/Ag(I) efflux system membrane fusion protein
MKKSVIIGAVVVIALVAAGAVGFGLGRERRATASPVAARAGLYHCPMHPRIVSDKPGHCPICQMTLVRDADEPPKTAGAGVPGYAAVGLSSRKRQLIGARTVAAELMPCARSIRAVGRIAIDERRMQHVHTKIQGWIEHIHAGAVGDAVRRGDPLLTIYSPELLASQREYLIALDQRARASGSSADVVADADRLVESAGRRLLLQDMAPAEIEELARTREAKRIVTLYSPVSGTITGRNVSHGERIESATSLLDIADLEQVWVLADVYESELPFVREGQTASIALSYLPGRTYRGRVAIVNPLVDPVTRTVTVRIELDNKDLALRPGMFASVALEADLGSRLSVPKDAVLRSGKRTLVFVAAGPGAFEPRVVDVGIELPDRWEITRGLAAGESVLASAGFFIDAESKLDAAVAESRP